MKTRGLLWTLALGGALLCSCNPGRSHINPYDPEGPSLGSGFYFDDAPPSGSSFANMNFSTGYHTQAAANALYAASVDDSGGTQNAYTYFPLPQVGANISLQNATLTFEGYSGWSYIDFYSLNAPFSSSMSWGSQPPASFFFTVSPTASLYVVMDATAYFAPRFKGTTPFYGFVAKARTDGGQSSGRGSPIKVSFTYKPQ
jgi:hypothetical protein